MVCGLVAEAQTVSASPAAVGATLFTEKGCAHCHGAQAQGSENGPDLRDMQHRPSKKRMREQIVNGGKSMPAFGDVLTDAEIKELIAFLRAQKPVRGAAAPAGQVSAPAR